VDEFRFSRSVGQLKSAIAMIGAFGLLLHRIVPASPVSSLQSIPWSRWIAGANREHQAERRQRTGDGHGQEQHGSNHRNFEVAWSVFRPVNCAVSGPAPRLQPTGGGGQSAYAEARGSGTLPPGHTWGARVLKPHEETEITSLSLSRETLLKTAKEFNAKKLRVQLGIAYANFPPEGWSHLPRWTRLAQRKLGTWRATFFDMEDAARQAL